MLFHGYGGLSQWGRLNRKIDPCRMLVWLGRRTVQNMEPSYHRIMSIHAVIWQAGTNWAGPVRIQIYYRDMHMPTKKFL